jgi:hypothetical protein
MAGEDAVLEAGVFVLQHGGVLVAVRLPGWRCRPALSDPGPRALFGHAKGTSVPGFGFQQEPV